MKKFDIEFSVDIRVLVDETKFTEEFMKDFRYNFYDFYTIHDHVEHLAQLYLRGIVDELDDFIEGYGDPKDFGIKFEQIYMKGNTFEVRE